MNKHSKWRQVLWFIGLYLLAIIVVGSFSYSARFLLGLPV